MAGNIKYDRHDEEWEQCLTDHNQKKVADTWLKLEDTLDRWRHNRMIEILQPIINSSKKYKWLTIGDGRYGTDANALIRLGAEDVFCTDISDKLLKIGNEKGLIKDFAEENAENLSFEDQRFDFVLCKESYHHFPRPHIALHEMLRVCKVGVVLIEPNDIQIDLAPVNRLINLVKRFFSRKNSHFGHEFEPVGNYVFSASLRELEKFQLGMHRRYLAYSFLNDYYEPGFEFINMCTSKNSEKKKILKTKLFIKIKDLLVNLKLMSPGLIATVLFKDKPNISLLEDMENFGWKINKLPKNPYM